MRIQINFDDIGYSTDSKELTALQRAREICELSEPMNGRSGSGRWEYFVWKTKTKRGIELEEVIVDNDERTLEYSFRKV